MMFYTREDVIKLTPLWTGERLEDGRPKVSADLLERMRDLTMEEIWGLSCRRGYDFQFESRFKTTHPTNKRLVGRAMTICLMPFREDLHQVCRQEAIDRGLSITHDKGGYNKAAVDTLGEDDVMVVDFYDKIKYGTYFGGNLSTAVANRTKRGGAVIWGGIRDLDQVIDIPDVQIYYRGVDPTPIRDYVMTGYNSPCMVGAAVCMPGDVVFGSNEGVFFLPSHLVEETVILAEKSHVRDMFGFQRLKERVYSATQIDGKWAKEMWDDFMVWFTTDESAKKYSYLDWSKDIADLEATL